MNTLCRSFFGNIGHRITSLPRCFAAKVWYGKYAVRAGVPLAGVVLFSGLAAVYSSGGPAGPPQTGIGRTEEKPASHEADWEVIRPRLEQAEHDSAEAVESQFAAINDFFAECKKGARPFAEAVLGTEGKLQAAGGIVEEVAGEVGKLFGYTPEPGPDSFTVYVERCYRQHVLDREQLQKEINRAIAGYAGMVREMEAKLLVDLGADLDFTSSLPEIEIGTATGGQSYAIVSEALHTAGDDLLASILRQTVSWIAGNAVGDQFTSKDATGLQKLGVGIIAGIEVDRGLDAAIAQAGYDPEGALTAKVTASLDRMSKLLVDGDARARKRYDSLCAFRYGYPDETIRAACREAVAIMEHGANIGLRRRLLAHHAERSRLREDALRKLVFGPGVPPADTAPSPRNDPENAPAPEKILELVQQCRSLYGGK